MLTAFLTSIRQAIGLSPRPQHIRLFEAATSIEDCLRLLEKAGRLPVGDLSISDEPPREVCTFPAMRSGLEYRIVSKISEEWRVADNGYIAGTVFETTEPCTLEQDQLDRMDPIVAAAVSIKHICVGTLHISKNCPGVYRDGVCTSCGDVSRY